MFLLGRAPVPPVCDARGCAVYDDRRPRLPSFSDIRDMRFGDASEAAPSWSSSNPPASSSCI